MRDICGRPTLKVLYLKKLNSATVTGEDKIVYGFFYYNEDKLRFDFRAICIEPHVSVCLNKKSGLYLNVFVNTKWSLYIFTCLCKLK